ncbi:hypothetical protein LJC53_07010 [Bacteroidales bacterium OttesenSCG-928-C03]|nr:hypothetical protein [Bacteroidales bacterium OttesenSCG-928-C03]
MQNQNRTCLFLRVRIRDWSWNGDSSLPQTAANQRAVVRKVNKYKKIAKHVFVYNETLYLSPNKPDCTMKAKNLFSCFPVYNPPPHLRPGFVFSSLLFLYLRPKAPKRGKEKQMD